MSICFNISNLPEFNAPINPECRNFNLFSIPKKSFQSNKEKKIKRVSSLGSNDSTTDDSLSISSTNTNSFIPSNYDFTFDAIDTCSNHSYENNIDDNLQNLSPIPSLTVLNSALSQKKKSTPDDTKYKTELCKNWSETGKCNYGKKCKFAHGREELNEKYILNNSRYKSKKCNSFYTTSFCPYGIRCLFAHEQRSFQDIKNEFYYQRLLAIPELNENQTIKNSRTLPAFKALRESPKPKNMGLFIDINDDMSFDYECNEGRSTKCPSMSSSITSMDSSDTNSIKQFPNCCNLSLKPDILQFNQTINSVKDMKNSIEINDKYIQRMNYFIFQTRIYIYRWQSNKIHENYTKKQKNKYFLYGFNFSLIQQSREAQH